METIHRIFWNDKKEVICSIQTDLEGTLFITIRRLQFDAVKHSRQQIAKAFKSVFSWIEDDDISFDEDMTISAFLRITLHQVKAEIYLRNRKICNQFID